MKKKVPDWIKQIRAARRQVEIDLQTPKEYAKVFKTSKKDKEGKSSNNIRNWE
jgi:hypothetical protein